MTKSNPYFICTKCREKYYEINKNSPVTFDVMLLCHCPDNEEEVHIDGINNDLSIRFVSSIIEYLAYSHEPPID